MRVFFLQEAKERLENLESLENLEILEILEILAPPWSLFQIRRIEHARLEIISVAHLAYHGYRRIVFAHREAQFMLQIAFLLLLYQHLEH